MQLSVYKMQCNSMLLYINGAGIYSLFARAADKVNKTYIRHAENNECGGEVRNLGCADHNDF